MIWYGMVWYVMVWYDGDMVWYGMVVVWYSMVWYVLAHGIVWYFMVGLIWNGVAWYGMVWYGKVWFGMVRCGLAGCLWTQRSGDSGEMFGQEPSSLAWSHQPAGEHRENSKWRQWLGLRHLNFALGNKNGCRRLKLHFKWSGLWRESESRWYWEMENPPKN